VILVRHGSCPQPPQDPDNPPTGPQNDPPLDEHGRHQAAAVAVRLEQEPIGAVFTTPLQRTVQTAAPLLEMKKFEATVIADLREVELGDWEHGELARRAIAGDPLFQEVMRAQRWELIPNAEAATVFAERVERGMLEAAKASGPDTVAVAFTHSAVIAEFCRQITKAEPFAFMTVANGSITRVVRMPDGRWVLVAFNETAHLPLDWQPRAKRAVTG
jgi:2,3-bisphosphoglycerate-dependent phosphoglycerate mutase